MGVVGMFMGGVANIAALSREIGVPTEASMPHAVSAALKNMAALCADIDFTFPEIQHLKDFLADPRRPRRRRRRRRRKRTWTSPSSAERAPTPGGDAPLSSRRFSRDEGVSRLLGLRPPFRTAKK